MDKVGGGVWKCSKIEDGIYGWSLISLVFLTRKKCEFRCGMSREFYYQRTDEYREIYNFVKQGDFPVPMIHSAVLIDLRYVSTDYLRFNRTILHEQIELLNKPPIKTEVRRSATARYNYFRRAGSKIALLWGFLTLLIGNGLNRQNWRSLSQNRIK